ncbi:3'-5' exonuclease [Chloroflexota bacterium]
MKILSGSVKQLLSRNPLFLDTETTGLGLADEIVEIAIVDSDGIPLLDTLIRPTIPVPSSATSIHGISQNHVSNAPSFDIIFSELLTIVENKILVIYNADYDIRMIRQSAKPYNLKLAFGEVWCAMHMAAEFFGDWNPSSGSYRWHKLNVAAMRCHISPPPNMHRAKADAELTRRLVQHIAGSEGT